MFEDASPSTRSIHLDVDVAGGKSTWVTAPLVTGDSLETVLAPRLATLKARDVPQSDGALHALVCATAAYLFHHSPEKLLRLRHEVTHKTRRGPFYVGAKSSV
jgi:hypothetical protein